MLNAQARAAWSKYLELDACSSWAQEAERHRQTLERTPLSLATERPRRPERLRLQEELLGSWALAWLAGRQGDAAQALTDARALATALALASGDPFLRESVAAIDAAAAQADLTKISALARGHRAYAEALTLEREERDTAALARFLTASRYLTRGGSPLAAAAEVEAATCELYLGRYRKVLARLDRSPVTLAYLVLAGRHSWIQGLADLKLASFSDSLRSYRRSLSLFQAAHEMESVAALHFLIAENLRHLGQDETAWDERLLALETAQAVQAQLWFHDSLFDAAEAARQEDFPDVALLFQSEMIESPLHLTDPISKTESYLRRSRTYNQLGDMASARRDVERARHWVARIQPQERRGPLQADLDLAEAEILLPLQPAEAVGLLDRAISFSQKEEKYFRLPELYRERARAFLALGQDGLAESDLESGLAECERQRRKVLDSQLQISYFEQAQPVFNEMIEFQALRRGSADRAFAYAESSRSRNLLDTLDSGAVAAGSHRASGPVAPSVVQSQLPVGVVLVEYVVLNGRSLAWVLARDRFKMIELPFGRRALAEKVEQLRRSISEHGGFQRVSEEIYDALIRPLDSHLHPGEGLVLIPDKSLYRLPFAALHDRINRKFLIEQRALDIAPSVAIFLKSLRRLAGASQPQDRILVVGDPAFDHSTFPDLPSLPGSRVEAEQIAQLYGTSKLLTGVDATRTEVLRSASSYSLIHFAAHSLANTDYPLLSSIILAPDRRHSRGVADSGILYAHEIYRLKLPVTRVVVLATCGSAGGRQAEGEGIASLARPFLAAGVPAVVGSLWAVDDRVAETIFVSFHRHLKAGADPVSALREAQIKALRSSDTVLRDPAAWSGFVVLGAVQTTATH